MPDSMPPPSGTPSKGSEEPGKTYPNGGRPEPPMEVVTKGWWTLREERTPRSRQETRRPPQPEIAYFRSRLNSPEPYTTTCRNPPAIHKFFMKLIIWPVSPG